MCIFFKKVIHPMLWWTLTLQNAVMKSDFSHICDSSCWIRCGYTFQQEISTSASLRWFQRCQQHRCGNVSKIQCRPLRLLCIEACADLRILGVALDGDDPTCVDVFQTLSFIKSSSTCTWTYMARMYSTSSQMSRSTKCFGNSAPRIAS